jgi:tripartite-type tricarboxylate transporter receptor subunit TctC
MPNTMTQRRSFLGGLLGSALATAAPGLMAQNAGGPVRLVIPAPPGGGADNIARLIAEPLASRLRMPVITDYKPGAGGLIATQHVMAQPPNGLTLYLSSSMLVKAPALEPEVQKYNPLTDLTPIARLTENAYVLVVRRDFPAKDLDEFIAYCRANPGKVSIATVGPGSNSHLSAAFLLKQARLDVKVVHYKGSAPGSQDLMGGFVDAKFENLAGVRSTLNSGRARVIAVGGRERSALFPGMKLFSESVPGFVFEDHFVVAGPPKMPSDLAERLSRQLGEIVTDKDVSEKLRDQLGAIAAPLDPKSTAAYLRDVFETTRKQAVLADLSA